MPKVNHGSAPESGGRPCAECSPTLGELPAGAGEHHAPAALMSRFSPPSVDPSSVSPLAATAVRLHGGVRVEFAPAWPPARWFLAAYISGGEEAYANPTAYPDPVPGSFEACVCRLLTALLSPTVSGGVVRVTPLNWVSAISFRAGIDSCLETFKPPRMYYRFRCAGVNVALAAPPDGTDAQISGNERDQLVIAVGGQRASTGVKGGDASATAAAPGSAAVAVGADTAGTAYASANGGDANAVGGDGRDGSADGRKQPSNGGGATAKTNGSGDATARGGDGGYDNGGAGAAGGTAKSTTGEGSARAEGGSGGGVGAPAGAAAKPGPGGQATATTSSGRTTDAGSGGAGGRASR